MDIKKLIVVNIKLYSVLLTTSLLISWQSDFERNHVVLHPSAINGRDYQKEITSAQDFTYSFLQSYINTLESKVNPKMMSLFPHTTIGYVGINLYISNTREMLILINDSLSEIDSVMATDLPIQTALLHRKVDIFSGKIKHWPTLNAIVATYDTVTAVFYLGVASNSGYKLTNISFLADWKIIGFTQENSVFFLQNFDFFSREDSSIVNVGFLTPANDWNGIKKFAKDFGVVYAQDQIQAVYFNSDYFKKVIAYDKLATFAKHMQELNAISIAKGDHSYTFVDFQNDRTKLAKMVAASHMGLEFTDNLLKEANDNIKKSTLLWTSTDFWGFTLQWILLSCLLLILLLVLNFALLKNIVINDKIKNIGVWGLVAGVHMWAFKSRPPDLPFSYWLLPGLLILITFIYCRVIIKDKDDVGQES